MFFFCRSSWPKMSQMFKDSTSSHVRRVFLDYFSQHPSLPHVIAKSTKVAPPTNDPTLPFVNAGMNAFKRVFLGQAKPPGCLSIDGKSSVANSQKVRKRWLLLVNVTVHFMDRILVPRVKTLSIATVAWDWRCHKMCINNFSSVNKQFTHSLYGHH